MGQKINPICLRLGINRDFESIWFASGKEYTNNFHEDLMVKKYLYNRLSNAMVGKVVIYRKTNSMTIDIHTARPGQVIGRKGSEIELLKNELNVLINKGRQAPITVFVNIVEVKKAWMDARLVGEEVSRQLKGRIAFRRAMKSALRNAMNEGALGIKIQCSGRLGGAEMARTERYQEGRTPLHTLRAEIDYALTECHTTYGVIGIKVWIYKGDVL